MLTRSWTRAAKWAARAVIVSMLLIATVGYVGLNKTVYVDVDGHIRAIETMGRDVRDVLGVASVSVTQDDLVVPSTGSRVSNGDYITVRTAKEIQVEIDGERRTLTTNAATVADVLEEMGTRAHGAEVSASRSSRIGRDLLKIQTQKTVTVTIDGSTFTRTTLLPTVRELLLELDVVLEEGDTVSHDLDEQLAEGQEIVVSRSGNAGDTVTETLPYETVEKEDPYLVKGEKVVLQKGRVGKAVTTYDVSTLDGKESDRVVLARSVLVQPTDEIIGIGTLDISNPANKILTPDEARALAKGMVIARGWEENQFECLNKLWTRESNWRVQAENRGSGAYGIPQALPGKKMGSVGSDWRTNAKTQITWGLNYVAGRYGDPCGAWSFFQSRNWY